MVIIYIIMELETQNSTITKQKNDSPQTLSEQKFSDKETILPLPKPFQKFLKAYNCITKAQNISESVKEYTMLLINNQNDDQFFQHCMENKFIQHMMSIMESSSYSSEVVKSIFQSLQWMLRGLKKEINQVYLMVTLSQNDFIDNHYKFKDEEDAAYYANFLKILSRKINEDEKYLSVFFNSKKPDFPLLLNLLKFHNCSDNSLHTSAKLTMIELCGNNNDKMQHYIANFPFVLFYPSYMQIGLDEIQNIMNKSEVVDLGNLIDNLKYLEDFVCHKNSQAINMHSNSFFALIGRRIYKYLHNKEKTPKVLHIVYTILKQITIQKIREGFQQLFSVQINSHLLKYIKGQTSYLDKHYEILTQCQLSIRQHCQAIFFGGEKKARKSIIKFMNSYIPSSNQYWLFQELKKLSQIIGVNVEINSQINHDKQNESSYLSALGSQPQYIQNPLYQSLIKPQSQQTLFWYLKICQQADIHININDLISQMRICTSLAVLRQFYKLVLVRHIKVDQTVNIQIPYNEVIEKLVYFIMGQSWGSLEQKVHLIGQNNFSQDIFRDIECEIVYFVSLRHILGTSNSKCSVDFFNTENNETRFKQIKVACSLSADFIQQIYLILDGQYIKLIDKNDQYVTIRPLVIRNFTVFNHSENSMQLIDKNLDGNGESYCLYFYDQTIHDYISRQLKMRKKTAMMAQMHLKTHQFKIQ